MAQKIMKKINALDKFNISDDNKKDGKEKENLIEKESLEEEMNDDSKFFKKKDDTFSSNYTNSSYLTVRTTQSMPFNKELDLDLPDFSPTKYAPQKFKCPHCFFYLLYSLILLSSNFCFVFTNNISTFNTLSLISHTCYFISSFLEWGYFKRGCIGFANLNSRVKHNIDKSLKAKILRSEQGCKYFFSFIGSIILILGNLYYLYYNKNNKERNKDSMDLKPDVEFWNINLIGVMVISLAEILKIEKILTETRQYQIKNDLSNSLIEISYFFASLCFGTVYYLSIMYDFDPQKYEMLFILLRIGGSLLTVFSSLFLFNRYYLSSFDDLNTSDISNITM